VLSLPFSHWNRDALPGIRIHDGEMLVSIGEIFGYTFCEGIEWVAKEVVIGGVWHHLDLEVNVNVIEGELNVVEAAMWIGDGRVGSFHLQSSLYL
jgi:hypothetical protein